MKYKSLGLAVLFAAMTGSVLAQNQISAHVKCGSKPDASQSIEVDDEAGHILIIEKDSCTWSVPLEMAGLKSTAYTQYEQTDLTGAKSQDRGYVSITMENADKAYIRFQGATNVKKEGAFTSQGTWSFTRGTGKLKGLKGKGSFKASSPPGGAAEIQVEGEYSLPEPSASTKGK